MPGPLIHLGVALIAVLLYFSDRYRMYALLLLPFAVLPDIDHYAPLYAPRELFHNVFLLVPPLAVALVGVVTKRTLLRDVGLMAGFLLFSHLLLDQFVGDQEALLFPLTTKQYALVYRVTSSHAILAFLPKSLVPYASVEALGVVVTLSIFGCLLLAKWLLQSGPDTYKNVTS